MKSNSYIFQMNWVFLLLCVVADTDQYNIGKSARELKNRTRRQSGCIGDQFQCGNGECIEIDRICDGKFDCTDSFDEAICDKKPGSCQLPKFPKFGTYEIIEGSTTPVPNSFVDVGTFLQFSCDQEYLLSPANKYIRCLDGNWDSQFPECLRCRVPDFPAFGTFKFTGSSTVPAPGNYTKGTLEYSCDLNYALSTNNNYISCVNGNWSGDFPECLRTCPSRKSETVHFECYLRGERRSCDQPFIEGSIIKMKCRENYKPVDAAHPYPEYATCRDGKWDNEILLCEPACGILPNITERVIDQQDSLTNLYPWHVTVYRKSKDTFIYACDGTIINPFTVVTTAYCVTDPNTKEVHPAEDYLVAAGKISLADLDYPENSSTIQKRQVKQIKIHPDYWTRKYCEADIALLRLEDGFLRTNSVGWVCIDWRLEYPVAPGSTGKIIGWKSSDLLLKNVETNIMSREKCLNNVDEYLREYILTDNFCSKLSEDQCTKCWFFQHTLITVNNLNLHFLTGIRTYAPSNCIHIYTNISSHLDFIKQANDWNK